MSGITYETSLSTIEGDPARYLTVNGKLKKPLVLGGIDFCHFPRRSIRAKDELGKESLCQGVALEEVLRAAGVTCGRELRGREQFRLGGAVQNPKTSVTESR